MNISCILLTWNSARYIEKCLLSLHQALERSGLTYEIILVDNGSKDETVEKINKIKTKNLILIQLGKNTGTTFSRNIAIKMAKGDYLCILDSDIEINDHSIFNRMLSLFGSNENIGLIAPRLIFPSGKDQLSVDSIPTVFTKISRLFGLRKIELDFFNNIDKSKTHFVDYAISAFWVLPRHVVSDVGLLDENIFYAPEDVDYCVRTWMAGYRVLYDPRVFATHHAQEISRRSYLSKSFYLHCTGLAYFWKKYKFFLSRPKDLQLHSLRLQQRNLHTTT